MISDKYKLETLEVIIIFNLIKIICSSNEKMSFLHNSDICYNENFKIMLEDMFVKLLNSTQLNRYIAEVIMLLFKCGIGSDIMVSEIVQKLGFNINDEDCVTTFMHKWKISNKFTQQIENCFVNNVRTINELEDNSDYNYISFGYFDETKFVDRYIIKYFYEEELKIIFNILWSNVLHKHHPYDFSIDGNTYHFDELIKVGHLCWNQLSKYYVACFAINFQKFEIWSRDRPSTTIDWFKTTCESSTINKITNDMRRFEIKKYPMMMNHSASKESY